jgi:hypothetical protein
LLFFELISRLERIRGEHGAWAAWWELAIQSAIADEQAAYDKEEQDRIGRMAGK